MSGKEQHGPGIETTPRFPETTPPLTPSSDYTYVLDAVMHMRQSMGQLVEAVSGLKESRTEQNKKLDTINEKLEKINNKLYAAVVLIMFAGALLGIFGKPIVEVIANRISPPAPAVAPTGQTPPTQPATSAQPTPMKPRNN